MRLVSSMVVLTLVLFGPAGAAAAESPDRRGEVVAGLDDPHIRECVAWQVFRHYEVKAASTETFERLVEKAFDACTSVRERYAVDFHPLER